MKQLIPNQFLFRFTFPCRYSRRLPGKGSHIVSLGTDYRLPFLGGMDGQAGFADVRIGWNENGIGICYEIAHKDEPIYGEADRPKACDGLSLWLDTRDTRSIHRASRYCQRFIVAAHDGSSSGAPGVYRRTIHRSLEDPPNVDLNLVQVARFALGDVDENAPAEKIRAYRLEVFFPAAVLYGFDPEINSRLGLFYRIRDKELGDQLIAAGPELPYWEDPSLWPVLELQKESD